jgi:GrpB-like predicted nucleotidyltransferase (UPF0157 family)
MNQINLLSKQELGKLFPIILVEHNEKWESLFIQEATQIFDTLGTSIFRLHHIGSTSVKGLISKPTIDILVEVSRNIDVNRLIDAMLQIGYEHNQKRDLESKSMMFMKGYSIKGFEGQAYHVHVRYPGDWDELYFCDYLSNHPETCKAYEKVKHELKTKYEFDREAYTEGKTKFIQSIVTLAREEYYPRYEIFKKPLSR